MSLADLSFYKTYFPRTQERNEAKDWVSICNNFISFAIEVLFRYNRTIPRYLYVAWLRCIAGLMTSHTARDALYSPEKLGLCPRFCRGHLVNEGPLRLVLRAA